MESPETGEQGTARRGRRRRARSFKEKVTRLVLKQLERSSKRGEMKLTMGDVIRVMEWQEKNGGDFDEVLVKWVEPPCEESASER